MKRLIILFLTITTLIACKSEKKEAVNLEENRAKSYDADDGYITMKGDFIYDEAKDAAVIQNQNEIYGVVVDDNMHMLNKKVKPFKANEFTSVPVTVRVKRIENTNPSIQWEQVLEIQEILKVEAPDETKEDVIKLSN